jgi:dimethylhistidine N-methyltransferase
MQTKTSISFETTFRQDIYRGLTTFPKQISSQYFYDEEGDRIFQAIMGMPEYYLTRAELAIFEKFKEEICGYFTAAGGPFQLIELGAGDGKKTKILLEELRNQGADFRYQPVDISENALEQLEKSIANDIPGIAVEGLHGTYFEVLEYTAEVKDSRKVILFLGSNIGNLLHAKAVSFLKDLAGHMDGEDLLFIGFDQKKHPQKVLDAYNDSQGITEAFNKNVLLRINKELGGNFKPELFLHWEVYDPESGTARSYLVAKEKHSVYIEALDLEISFEAWETIHTEISQKYDDPTVTWLAEQAGLQIVTQFTDTGENYRNYLLKRKP